MSDATCKTCPYSGDVVGRRMVDGLSVPTAIECRRHAPTHIFGAGDSSALFPAMRTEDWCGSHPDRQPHLECATATLVGRETCPTEADMRRIIDALEQMARRTARAKP